MNARKLSVIVAAVAVVAAAVYIAERKAPTTEVAAELLYPGLIERINDAARIELATREHALAITRLGNGWVIESRDNFPATFATVKQALVQLAELRILEAKTAKPENYARIGVEDIASEKSGSRLVSVYGPEKALLASLLIGKERLGKGLGSPAHYVRKSGEGTAYLVDGDLTFSANMNDWLDAAVANIPAERIRRVAINPYEGQPVVISKTARNDQFFNLEGVPPGFEPRSKAEVSSIGSLLLDLNFEDVAAASKLAGLVPRTIVEVQTFDGLVATIEQYDLKEFVYAKFSFAFNPDLVVAEPAADKPAADKPAAEKPGVDDEVKKLNEKVSGWAYVLPDYKLRLIDKKIGNLIKKVEPPPPKENAGKAPP